MNGDDFLVYAIKHKTFKIDSKPHKITTDKGFWKKTKKRSTPLNILLKILWITVVYLIIAYSEEPEEESEEPISL